MSNLAVATPTNTALAEASLMSWEQKKEMASMLIKSGFLPPALKTPEQVIAVMMKGQELGIPAMEALTSINVIQQKPTLSPQLMLALARRTGELEDFQIEKLTDSVKITVKRKGQTAVTTEFGNTEAKALGLDKKDNYLKQRHVMYQWRALGANLRITFSDVIAGMYTPEEMGAPVRVMEDGSQEIEQAGDPIQTFVEQGSASIARGIDAQIMFDPTKDCIEKGKYAGTLWIEVPADYLEWASKQSGDLALKGKATLTYMEANKAPETPSPFDGVFDVPPKQEDASNGIYERLAGYLQTISNEGTLSDLEKWGTDHKDEIKTLPAEVQGSLRKAYKEMHKRLSTKK